MFSTKCQPVNHPFPLIRNKSAFPSKYKTNIPGKCLLCTFTFQGGINTGVIIAPSVPKVFQLFAGLSSTGQSLSWLFAHLTDFLHFCENPMSFIPFFFTIWCVPCHCPFASKPVFQTGVTLGGVEWPFWGHFGMFFNHPLSSFSFYHPLFLIFFHQLTCPSGDFCFLWTLKNNQGAVLS